MSGPRVTSTGILLILQVVASAALVLVGSLAEAYGYGLSLGTAWPYRRDILRLASHGDPEAWHRLVATLLGINGVILAILLGGTNAWSGLLLIIATALLGIATLHVLAGRAPAFLHGLHELLAYATLTAYVSQIAQGSPSMWALLRRSVPLHPFLLMVFLGGMVTGQRGFKTPIGQFVVPRTPGQWMFAVHLGGWLLLVLTLAWYGPPSSVALLLALLQVLLGFALYQSINARPERPGVLTAMHQGTALLLFLSLVFSWRIPISLSG
jgi:hypothetical protein